MYSNEMSCFFSMKDYSEMITKYSFSGEQLGQFEPNRAQSILRLREFKFVQMNGHAPLRGDYSKIEKICYLLLRNCWTSFNDT